MSMLGDSGNQMFAFAVNVYIGIGAIQQLANCGLEQTFICPVNMPLMCKPILRNYKQQCPTLRPRNKMSSGHFPHIFHV